MKVKLSIAAAFFLVFSGAAYAKKPEGVGPKAEKGEKPTKVAVCHNGSTYLTDITSADPELLVGDNEMAVSFVINISSSAVQKHLDKHEDCPGLFEEGEEIDVCELDAEADMVVCEKKISCECLELEA